jgi:hypothetical protein
MKNIFIFAIFLTCLSVSCKQSRNANRIKDMDSLKSMFMGLTDSVDVSWKAMIEKDDNKISNIKRLLQEVSYTKTHNQSLLDSLQRLQTTLTSKRYTPETMASERIDAYDLATDSLVTALPRLMASVPNIESYPLCAELNQEIQAANESVLVERIHYDKHARAYNQFVKEYSKELKEVGYENLQPKMLFQLGS